ncbi:hypothetical protein DSAG12_03370 [Promethearchaeum syntrophicum]|uniref:Uncharacterized protein n=1 Tax=Promethearchaeum syntrophicum TaxID=2594042 RepID=A0A5B9DFG9_9ARCH|nr:hypothetical protein [Candidatus Prometheoarchaeum syntrophicum]QEE17533.1 hypothetical protein DSAG12_03370 [Candidatus Prometheoarchaeum syntrophicum]
MDDYLEKIQEIAQQNLVDSDLIIQFLTTLAFFSEIGWDQGYYKIGIDKGFQYPFEQNRQDFPKLFHIFDKKDIQFEKANEVVIELDKLQKIVEILIHEEILEEKGRYIKIKDEYLQAEILFTNFDLISDFAQELIFLQNLEFLNSFFKMLYIPKITAFIQNDKKKILKIKEISAKTLNLPELNSLKSLNEPINSELLFRLSTIINSTCIIHIQKLFEDKNQLKEFPLKNLTNRSNFRSIFKLTIKNPSLFEKTMDIILLLSEAENENYINNATGLFSYYFCKNIPRFNISLKQRKEYLIHKLKTEEKRIKTYIPSIINNIFRTQAEDSVSYGDHVKIYLLNEGNLTKEQKEKRRDEEYELFGLELIKTYYHELEEKIFFITLDKFWKIICLEPGWITLTTLWKGDLKKNPSRKFKLLQFLRNYIKKNESPYKTEIESFIQLFEAVYNIYDLIKKEIQKPYYLYKREEKQPLATDFANQILLFEDSISNKVSFLIKIKHDFISLIGEQMANQLEITDDFNPWEVEIIKQYEPKTSDFPYDFLFGFFNNMKRESKPQWQSLLDSFFTPENFKPNNLKLIRASYPLNEWGIKHLEVLKENEMITYNDYKDFGNYFNEQALSPEYFERLFSFYFINNPDLDIWREFPSGFFHLYDYLKKYTSKLDSIKEDLFKLLIDFKLSQKSFNKSFSEDWFKLTCLFMRQDSTYIPKFLSAIGNNIYHSNFPSDFKRIGLSPFYRECYKLNPQDTIKKIHDLFEEKRDEYLMANFLEYKLDLKFLLILSQEQIFELCQLNEQEIPLILINIIGDDIYQEESRPIIAILWKYYQSLENIAYRIYNSFNSGVMVSSPGKSYVVYENRLKRFQEWSRSEIFDNSTKLIEIIEEKFSAEILRAKKDDAEFGIAR